MLVRRIEGRDAITSKRYWLSSALSMAVSLLTCVKNNIHMPTAPSWVPHVLCGRVGIGYSRTECHTKSADGGRTRGREEHSCYN